MFLKKLNIKSKRAAILAFAVPFLFLLGYIAMVKVDTPVERSPAREAQTLEQSDEEFFPGETEPEAPAAETVEDLPPELEAELSTVLGVIARGDTVGKILQAWLSAQEILALDAAARSVYSLRNIKIGQPYAVYTDDENFVSFEYEIDNEHKLQIKREADVFSACLVTIEYDIKLHRLSGEIRSNLFQAMSDLGEKPALAVALADVFAWEINFIRDLRQGDNFVLLVEKRYRDGEFKGYGKLLAAFFYNQNHCYEAFLFRDGEGQSQYYTRNGQSLRRSFLKAPLSFTRISSGYSNSRLHPVTMDWKAHPAIDYAAPTGTPVKSVGKGKVVFVGYSKSAGNYITIDHPNGHQTMYLHLSGFAKGLRKGDEVIQGQVIGFVGKTGYATGPHLDFRMKKNGKYINPLSLDSPRDTPVSQPEMPSFKQQIDLYLDYLEERRNLAEYRREDLKL